MADTAPWTWLGLTRRRRTGLAFHRLKHNPERTCGALSHHINILLANLIGDSSELEIIMRRSVGWAWRVKSMLSLLTSKKAERYDRKLEIPQFASWIPNVPYLEIVECQSGIEIYKGEGKFWVKGQAVSSIVKARRLARAISDNAEWIKNEKPS